MYRIQHHVRDSELTINFDDRGALTNWIFTVLEPGQTNSLKLRGIFWIILCLLGLTACPGESAFAADIPSGWPTQGVVVEKGRVYYLNAATLASSRLGIIRSINVKEGSQVKAGDELLILDDRLATAQLNTAQKQADNKIEIEYAAMAAEVARVEYEMNLQANMRVPGAVPQIEVERLRLTLMRSLLQIKQAMHQQDVEKLKRDEASQAVQTFHIEAEFDGIVTKIYKQRGEAIREGDPILDVSNPEIVKVQGYIHYTDIHRVKKGDPVKVRLKIPEFDIPQEDTILDGELVFVDTSVDFVEQQKIRVWAEVKNKDLVLAQGFLAEMVIVTDDKAPEPRAPRPKTASNPLDQIPRLR